MAISTTVFSHFNRDAGTRLHQFAHEVRGQKDLRLFFTQVSRNWFAHVDGCQVERDLDEERHRDQLLHPLERDDDARLRRGRRQDVADRLLQPQSSDDRDEERDAQRDFRGRRHF